MWKTSSNILLMKVIEIFFMQRSIYISLIFLGIGIAALSSIIAFELIPISQFSMDREPTIISPYSRRIFFISLSILGFIISSFGIFQLFSKKRKRNLFTG